MRRNCARGSRSDVAQPLAGTQIPQVLTKKSFPLSSTRMNAGKSFDLDLPDGFHAELGVLEDLDLADVLLGEDRAPGRRCEPR
jgi:hypothetical protein